MTTVSFRQFELECSIKCQDISIEDFCVWMSDIPYSHEFLTSYALRKCNFVSVNNELNELINEISIYIYRTYKYNYLTTLPESIDIDTDSELDDLPDLIDTEDNIVDDLTLMLTNLRNSTIEEVVTDEMLTAALINDYRSAILFQEMFTRIREERLLQKKFKIESVVEEGDTNCEDRECCICYNNCKSEDFVSLNCKHEFCKTCIKNSIKSDKRPEPCCAYCRGKISKMTSRTIEVQSELSELII